MSCQQVPTTPAFNPYPRSVQVGEFEVAIGGGIWVAIGAHEGLHYRLKRQQVQRLQPDASQHCGFIALAGLQASSH